jgi:hypothetical protein
LEGDVAITFTSVARVTTVGVDLRARAGGFSAAFFDPGEDVCLVVIYTIKDESGKQDHRSWVETSDSRETALAFDISERHWTSASV